MTDDERNRQFMTVLLRNAPDGAVTHALVCACLEALPDAIKVLERADGERIKALERLEEAADLLRIVIEKSKGVWCCDFAEDANGEWDGEHCPWSDFECVTHFLQALNASRERQGG